MKNVGSSLALLAFVFTAPAFAATYNLEVPHTNVGFGVKHMGFSTVRGEFKTFSGTINYDPKKPDATKIKVEIDAASIDTGTPKRDGHLKSKDFFEVEKFPKITFVSKSAKAEGKDKMNITGDLTMHGVTKSVVLKVEEINGPTKSALDKKEHVGASASLMVNRQDYGLVWNGGGLTGFAGEGVVANEVKIQLDVDAVKE